MIMQRKWGREFRRTEVEQQFKCKDTEIERRWMERGTQANRSQKRMQPYINVTAKKVPSQMF